MWKFFRHRSKTTNPEIVEILQERVTLLEALNNNQAQLLANLTGLETIVIKRGDAYEVS